MKARILSAAVAAAVTVTAGIMAFTTTANATAAPDDHASGLPWSDGGYFEHDPAQADAFAAWRGRPVDNILAFTARETWAAQLNESKGVPFALGEFSVATASSASGGDNPNYFTHVYTWLAARAAENPGSIAFVSLFNETAEYCQCNVNPTTPNPNAAARYRSLIQSLSSSSGR